jgi:hypothetical protein
MKPESNLERKWQKKTFSGLNISTEKERLV